MGNALFNLKSQIFSLFDTILTVLDQDPDLYQYCQYGSGSRAQKSHFNTDPHGSGSEKLVKTFSRVPRGPYDFSL